MDKGKLSKDEEKANKDNGISLQKALQVDDENYKILRKYLIRFLEWMHMYAKDGGAETAARIQRSRSKDYYQIVFKIVLFGEPFEVYHRKGRYVVENYILQKNKSRFVYFPKMIQKVSKMYQNLGTQALIERARKIQAGEPPLIAKLKGTGRGIARRTG